MRTLCSLARLSVLACVALLAPACEELPTGGAASAPAPGVAPLGPEFKVVPVALDPDRPQPPAPGALELSRTQERTPAQAH